MRNGGATGPVCLFNSLKLSKWHVDVKMPYLLDKANDGTGGIGSEEKLSTGIKL